MLGKFFAGRDEAATWSEQNFRVLGPDETASNRLEALFEVTGKTWEAAKLAGGRESRH